MQQHPVYKPFVEDFLQGRLEPQWPHRLREAWRANTWKKLVRDRPQHFAGAGGGINKELTIAWLLKLTERADTVQFLQDKGLLPAPSAEEDPRAKLKVLCMLLTRLVEITPTGARKELSNVLVAH